MAKTPVEPAVPEIPEVRYGDAEGGGCDQHGCSNREAFRCLYRDRRAIDCAWVACRDHLTVVGGRAYCHRHATTVEVLGMAMSQGTRIQPPDLDDRCASLVLWVARDLDGPVVERLIRWGDSNMSIINDPVIRYARQDRARHEPGHWERVWALATRTGLLLRIAVRVEDSRPETVILVGGRTELLAVVPPWIQDHLNGSPGDGVQSDLVERMAFQQKMLVALDEYAERYGIGFPHLLMSSGR